MKNLLKNIWGYFFKNSPKYPLGAILNGVDIRDIHLAAVQVPVKLPTRYETDLSMFEVINQRAHGTCTWQDIEVQRQYYWYKKTGQKVRFSARSGYAYTKLIDGMPNIQGTYPRTAANVAISRGIAEHAVVPDDNSLPYSEYLNVDFNDSNIVLNMQKYILGGYTFVPEDYESIKQAIYQNGLVGMTLGIDVNWFIGLIIRVLNIFGYHRVIGWGFDDQNKTIFGRNSWGKEWVASLARSLGIPDGNFVIKWEDYKDNIHDIIAFTDIPIEIIQDIKKMPYRFTRTLKYGDKGEDVLKLQERYDSLGLWPLAVKKAPIYGPTTREITLKYQLARNIIRFPSDSNSGYYCGPRTIRDLNGDVGLTIEQAIIQQESGGNLWAIGDRNLRQMAYGPMQIRQPACDDVNRKFGTNYQAKDMLGNLELSLDVFHKYILCYPENTENEHKARLWNGGPSWRLKSWATDHYWYEVSSMLK